MLFTTSAPPNSLVSGLFLRDQEEIVHSVRSGSRRHAALSVFSKFRESLASLMETLQSSSPLFIRCLKPNAMKKPGMANSDMLLEQLRYTGMLETVRIRKSGYPRRLAIPTVLERYSQLVKERRPDHDQLSINDKTIVLLDKLMPGGYPNLWQVGKTKVFLTDAAFSKLETQVKAATAMIVIKMLRGNVQRQKFLRSKKSLTDIQAGTLPVSFSARG